MLNRRHFAIAGVSAAAITGLLPARAASKDEAAVTEAVEAFRKAMLANDRQQLTDLSADGLSYGHSSGKVQNKTVFVDEAVKSHWKSISMSDETTEVVGNNAIVRFIFTGQNESQGKINDVKLGILMVWVKQNDRWQLLARQGYKI